MPHLSVFESRFWRSHKFFKMQCACIANGMFLKGLYFGFGAFLAGMAKRSDDDDVSVLSALLECDTTRIL